MPIEISEFNEKGTDTVRTGFGGKITSKVLELLRSEKSAFSLEEVAKAGEVDLSDKKANHGLMNVLYVQRVKKGTITMKVVDGVKYYVANETPTPTKTVKAEKPVESVADEDEESEDILDDDADTDDTDDADEASDESEDDTDKEWGFPLTLFFLMNSDSFI